MEIKRIEIDRCCVSIETDKGDISCHLDGGQKCCESFGVILSIHDGESFEAGYKTSYDTENYCDCDEHYCDCDLCDKNGKILHECIESDLKNYIGQKIKNISFDYPELNIEIEGKKSISIKPYVNHNGYYPHDFSVKYPGFEEELEIGKNPPDIYEIIEKLGSL